MERYKLSFEIVNTESEAKAFCERENTTGTRYKQKNKKAHYTPWSDSHNCKHKFVCWYYY